MTEEKIQDYVNGNLPEAEAAEVAASLAADPALARLADQYRLIYRGLRQQRINELEKDLLQFDQAGSGSSKKEGGIDKRWYWGGGLLLLLLLVLGYVQQKNHYSDRALAERYFVLPPDPRIAGPEPDESRAYFRAIDNFYADAYQEAVTGFSGLQSSNDYGTIASFYLPHAHYLSGNYSAADRSFDAALALSDLTAADREQLDWNAMITKLALGENISDQLNREWGRGYPVAELRAALNSFWR